MMVFPPQVDNGVDAAVKQDRPAMTVADSVKTSTVVSHTQSLSQPKENEKSELLTNDIIVDKGKRHECPAVLVYFTEIIT